MGDEVAQCLDERLVGQQGILVGAAVEHDRAGRVDLLGELGREAGLPDAGLADEQHEARRTVAALLPARAQPRGQLVAPDERAVDELRRHGGHDRGAGGGRERRRGRLAVLSQHALVQRDERRRRRRAELVAQEDAHLLERQQRLRDVALPRLRLHEQGVAGLAKRLAGDERARESLRRGQVAVAERDARLGADLERSRREVVQALAPRIDPVAGEIGQQRAPEHVEHAARHVERGSRAAIGERALGKRDLRLHDLDVDLRGRRELERQRLAAADEPRFERAADLREDARQRRLRRGRRVRRPQHVEQLVAADGAVAMQDEVGDEGASLATGELLGEVAAAAANPQSAEQRERQGRRGRRGIACAAGQPKAKVVVRGFGEHAHKGVANQRSERDSYA